MGLLGGLLELLAPTRCAGCEYPGDVLCAACIEALARIAPATSCPRCAAPWGALICTECWQTVFAFERACAVGELNGTLARAVVLHKDGSERRLGASLGALLGEAVDDVWRGWATTVCWIPPTAAALKRRGFDHGESIAVPAAQTIGVAASSLLVRPTARDQRTLSRAERLACADGSFSAAGPVAGRVIVVDDVMTTGATLDAAARALLAAGAEAVRVAVVARAW